MKLLLSTIAFLFYTPLSAQWTDTISGRNLTTAKGDVVEINHNIIKHEKFNNSYISKTTHKSQPFSINGHLIYYPSDDRAEADLVYKTASSKNSTKEYKLLHARIDSLMSDYKDILPSGVYTYELNNMVVGTDGSVVYYETDSMQWQKPGHEESLGLSWLAYKQHIGRKINMQIDSIISQMRYTPFVWQGKPTPFASHFEYKMSIPIQ